MKIKKYETFEKIFRKFLFICDKIVFCLIDYMKRETVESGVLSLFPKQKKEKGV